MSDWRGELQRSVAGARRKLEDCLRRLAALRDRMVEDESADAGTEVGRPAALPLFQGLGSPGGVDDLELHFEVLDAEDPGRGER